MHICCHVYLSADNWLHVSLLCFDREFDCAIERGVVGDGKRGHAELFGTVKKRVNASWRGEEAIVRVNVEMCERHG